MWKRLVNWLVETNAVTKPVRIPASMQVWSMSLMPNRQILQSNLMIEELESMIM